MEGPTVGLGVMKYPHSLPNVTVPAVVKYDMKSEMQKYIKEVVQFLCNCKLLLRNVRKIVKSGY